jgi:hypothetical protein
MKYLKYLMQLIYRLLGRLFFSRHQPWEQERNIKTMLITIAFALLLGLAISKGIHMLYNHQK